MRDSFRSRLRQCVKATRTTFPSLKKLLTTAWSTAARTSSALRRGSRAATACAALLASAWAPLARGSEYVPFRSDSAERVPVGFQQEDDGEAQGTRLRIRRVNHQGSGLPLNTPTGGWEPVNAPQGRYVEELQPPRFEDDAPSYDAGPRGLMVPPNEPQVFPSQRPIPVRQPLPGGPPMPSPMVPRPLPGNGSSAPGPLDCADLERFFDPTPFDVININISVERGESRPPECPLPESVIFPNHPIDVYHRDWACLTYTWKASALCHKPLYFEEMSAERYGHSWGYAQPLVSGAHFFGSILTLPYQMGVHPPGECIYALGYYRPGDCAPKIWYQAPLSIRGAFSQAATVTGLVYLIP